MYPATVGGNGEPKIEGADEHPVEHDIEADIEGEIQEIQEPDLQPLFQNIRMDVKCGKGFPPAFLMRCTLIYS